MAPYLASAGGAPSGPCQMLGTAVACMEKRVCTAAAVSTASLPSAQNKRAYIVLACACTHTFAHSLLSQQMLC